VCIEEIGPLEIAARGLLEDGKEEEKFEEE
jgi:hypothetical protein